MRRIAVIFIISFFVLSSSPAYAYWIWTPKTGKWTNPKTAAKSTPKEQFDVAKDFYDAKKYDDAKREFKKLLKAFPKSAESAEGQYYLGLVEDEEGNIYDAYLAYQKVIDKYPFSERIPQIIEREYKIGEEFLSGAKRKVMGVSLPVENPAIEIFTKVIENSTYGPLAPAAQYKLGLALKGVLRYYEAEDAFNKVVSNYPDSKWAAPAKFQIASCRAAVSRGPQYDQGAAGEAKEKFEEFVKEHPDAVLSAEAQKNIELLNEKEAASDYSIARFYEKQKAFDAARIYYNDVISKYPNSPWAIKASEKLQELEKKK
ncbi:MAG: outer membrane protein assembly factor BamD [Candidatus Omnitrophica bacterium]|nr:outer membrane protein assembly factor BamD [Candidatus Omnitrophota bacterium]